MSVKQQIGLDGLASDTTRTFASDTSSGAATEDSVTANFISIEKQLLDEAITVSNAILAFPKWKDISARGIERREEFESRALSLRNRSMDIYRQIRNLNPPNEERMHYELLLAAADNLRLAGYETHFQFGQDDSSGDNLNRAMIYAAQARAAFLQLKEQL
ncbi:MAG: hypothetical protein LBC85_11405 [Fibromonadaceae bacterium]|nr:hypothetical protein [Fibromonadaceae bacterium]